MTEELMPIGILVVIIVIVLLNGVRILRDDQRAVVFRLGRSARPLVGGVGPGLILVVPVIDKLIKIRIGARGVVQQDLEPVGTVVINEPPFDGEPWGAKSETGIRSGEHVEVIGVDAYRVVVKRVEDK